jgi:hypothetical protein
MTFEEWYEENFGAVEPGVPFHLPVLKFAYESGAKKREWVGLTNEEIVGFIAFEGASLADFVRAIEAKLKEKNT